MQSIQEAVVEDRGGVLQIKASLQTHLSSDSVGSHCKQTNLCLSLLCCKSRSSFKCLEAETVF